MDGESGMILNVQKIKAVVPEADQTKNKMGGGFSRGDNKKKSK